MQRGRLPRVHGPWPAWDQGPRNADGLDLRSPLLVRALERNMEAAAAVTPPPKALRPECCPTCGTGRYCAPRRCYCGHEACPAYGSYIDLSTVPLPPVPEQPKSKGGRR